MRFSAIIYNALIIIALIPLALKGVKYREVPAGKLLSHNLLIYGLGGTDRSVYLYQGHRRNPRLTGISIGGEIK